MSRIKIKSNLEISIIKEIIYFLTSSDLFFQIYWLYPSFNISYRNCRSDEQSTFTEAKLYSN